MIISISHLTISYFQRVRRQAVYCEPTHSQLSWITHLPTWLCTAQLAPKMPWGGMSYNACSSLCLLLCSCTSWSSLCSHGSLTHSAESAQRPKCRSHQLLHFELNKFMHCASFFFSQSVLWLQSFTSMVTSCPFHQVPKLKQWLWSWYNEDNDGCDDDDDNDDVDEDDGDDVWMFLLCVA